MRSAASFRVEIADGIATARVDNPPRNLLTLAMVSELAARVPDLEKDESVRAIVVAGAGPADFSSGIDMVEWAKLAPKDAQSWITRGQDALWALEHLTKPVVAAVHGAARGAGAELALACDIRLADETAVFSLPEVDVGWMPSRGGTARLSRIVGRSKALELLLTGKSVKALDALRLGIVDHLSAPGQAITEAHALAALFARKPRDAVKAIKRTLIEGDEKPYRNRFLLESQHAVQLLWTEAYSASMKKLREPRP
ncbi:MAG: enoyl-CoA hydratase/isomerase family protein [Thermoplasmata archaeon]|nr:enoyl-CoA hydratase/isomerase family protein [Thermoplasmata archaeon]